MDCEIGRFFCEWTDCCEPTILNTDRPIRAWVGPEGSYNCQFRDSYSHVAEIFERVVQSGYSPCVGHCCEISRVCEFSAVAWDGHVSYTECHGHRVRYRTTDTNHGYSVQTQRC